MPYILIVGYLQFLRMDGAQRAAERPKKAQICDQKSFKFMDIPPKA